MLILSTVIPNEGIQMKMMKAFPDLNFIYQKGWKDEAVLGVRGLELQAEDADPRDYTEANNEPYQGPGGRKLEPRVYAASR